MDRAIYGAVVWVLFLGGLFGVGVGIVQFFAGRPVTEYAGAGIGAGLYLFGAAILVWLRERSGRA